MKRWIRVLLLFLLTGSIMIWTATQSQNREEQSNVCELKLHEMCADITPNNEIQSVSSDTIGTRCILHNDEVTEVTKNRKPDSSPWYLNIPKQRTLSVALDVSETYKPTLNFYCETSERGQYWGITSIYTAAINRNYNGTVQQLNGDVHVWLVSPYEIAYIVDGDFCDIGSTQSSYHCSKGEVKAYQE